MFEDKLIEDLKKIFDVQKVTFDKPDSINEQELIFVDIQNTINQIKDTEVEARVYGTALMFGNTAKLKHGYFAKRIAKASTTLTDKFHFSDLEQNSNVYRNIAQRSFSFVYFFSDQYDPNKGSITELNTYYEES